jgi:acetyl-CoA C-acetyltransferase
MTEALIIDACRTPRGIGKLGKGALADMHPQHLGAAVLKALAERTGINTAEVDDIIWGTSAQRGPQGGDLGRMSALDAGYDVRSSGVTLDRFCGSGITTVNLAAASIMSGMEDLVIAGGTEMMSMSGRRSAEDGPMMMDAATCGCAPPIRSPPGCVRRRHRHDGRHPAHRAGRAGPRKPAARRARDRQRPLRSQPDPVFKADGTLALDHEEFPRPQTTAEGLAGLKPAFTALADVPLDDRGTTFRSLILQEYPDLDIQFMHHAGNSSGVVDGSAALLLASPRYAKANG